MAYNYEYPYTDTGRYNADWMLNELKRLSVEMVDFVKLNTIKYADPINWDISKQYEANTVVIDMNTGKAYLSVAPVPSGASISDTNYWEPILTLDFLSANQNLTSRNDGTNILATFTSTPGDWLIWNGILYKVLSSINVNEAYVPGYNIDQYTIEQFIRDYIGALENKIGDLNDLDTTDQSSIVNAINEIFNNIGLLSALTTTDKTSVVAAINEVNDKVDNIESVYINVKDYGATGDGSTDDHNAIVAAIADGVTKQKAVYFPGGVYRIANAITLPTNCHIIGSSDNDASILCDFSGVGITTGVQNTIETIKIEGSAAISDVVLVAAGFCEIKNTTVVGGGNGIRCTVGQCTITGSHMTNQTAFAFVIDSTNDVNLSQCWLTNFQTGGVLLNRGCEALNMTNSVIVSNHSTYNGVSAVVVGYNSSYPNETARYCKFTNCYIDNCTNGISLSHALDISFVNCWICALSPGASVTMPNAEDIRFVGCDFYNNGNVALLINGNSCIVDACSFVHNTNVDIRVLDGITGFIITNNQFIMPFPYNASTQAMGLLIEGAGNGFIIKNNIFKKRTTPINSARPSHANNIVTDNLTL